MHITTKDFEDNPHLTPVQIIKKLEDEKYEKARKQRAEKRKNDSQ